MTLLLEWIGTARKSLCLYFYIFAADPVGVEIRDALIAARRRGVAVVLMVDAFGSSNTPDAFFAPLVGAGARFGRFGARRSTRYLIRNHQKMIIVDSRKAMIGGFNIEESYFTGGGDTSGWYDLALVIAGSEVARLQTWYDNLAIWVLDSPQRFRALRRLVRHWHAEEGALQWLMGGPTKRLSSWALRVKADLDHARRLDMVAAYFSPGRGMLKRITRIAGRGDARVVLPRYSDNMMTVGAARHLYRRMISSGIKLREYGASKLHMKLIVADNIVYVGSANFDKRSLFLNVELMLRIEDAAFAARVRDLIVQIEERSHVVDRAAYRQMTGPLARLRWFISYVIVGVVDYTVTRRLNFRDEPR